MRICQFRRVGQFWRISLFGENGLNVIMWVLHICRCYMFNLLSVCLLHSNIMSLSIVICLCWCKHYWSISGWLILSVDTAEPTLDTTIHQRQWVETLKRTEIWKPSFYHLNRLVHYRSSIFHECQRLAKLEKKLEKKSIWSMIYTFYFMILYIYITLGQELTTPGSKHNVTKITKYFCSEKMKLAIMLSSFLFDDN